MSFAKHILFPVDFSVLGEILAPQVAWLAARFSSRVTLLHVSEHQPGTDAPGDAAALEKANVRLHDFLAAPLAGVPVERAVRTGRPVEQIVDYARQNGADLIALPTHGYTRFRRLLLGSVTAGVLHDSSAPVWTMAHCEYSAHAPVGCRRILCAIDFGAESVDVLRTASRFAAQCGAALEVVHSVPAVDPRFYSAAAERAHTLLVDAARRDYAAIAQQAGAGEPLQILEEHGLVEPIARVCETHKTDVLVIGRGKIGHRIDRILAHAYELIRLAPCPVLSV